MFDGGHAGARRRCVTGAVCLAAVTTSVAHAQTSDATSRVEGTVLLVEDDDVIVDLGSQRGATEADVVELWRPLRLKHPVTGHVVTDRFLVGMLRLKQVRPNLSLAVAEGKPSRSPEAGDVVVLTRVIEHASPSPSPSQSASQSPLPQPPGAAALAAQPSVVVTTHPPPAPPLPVLDAQAQSVGRVFAGEPLRIGLAIHGDASGAVLHARRVGATAYASEPMTRVGPEYWAATVPADAVQSPSLEWFAEAVGPDGTRPVVGEADSPRVVEVDDVRPGTQRRVIGEARLWTDYASFDVRSNNDYVWQTEGVMGARFDDVGVRAVRTGFGVYRGVGGSLQQLDVQNMPGTAVGLTYGYLETELGFAPALSLDVRGVVGLQQGGVGGGISSFLRIGSDLQTNLLLGGEVLGTIGVRGIAEFDWNSFRDFPIVLRSEVTNQPAGADGDVGVRLITQVGYRVLPHLVVALRGSYQGRTIQHAGPGGGAAVGYAW